MGAGNGNSRRLDLTQVSKRQNSSRVSRLKAGSDLTISICVIRAAAKLTEAANARTPIAADASRFLEILSPSLAPRPIPSTEPNLGSRNAAFRPSVEELYVRFLWDYN